jgi:hypothetical protein
MTMFFIARYYTCAADAAFQTPYSKE